MKGDIGEKGLAAAEAFEAGTDAHLSTDDIDRVGGLKTINV